MAASAPRFSPDRTTQQDRPRSAATQELARRASASRFTTKQKLLIATVPYLAAGLIRVLCSTLRYQNITAPGVTPGDELPGPSIYAFWHRSLLIAAHRFRNRNIAILISRSFDGELIARTVELLGFHAVRGSSSTGGVNGLRFMGHAYRNGHICAFTADGPKGPAQIAKAGPAQLAELVSAPHIGAFAVIPERAWSLNSWDRMFIPKPFSKVRVTWPALTEPTIPKLQQTLNESERMARPS